MYVCMYVRMCVSMYATCLLIARTLWIMDAEVQFVLGDILEMEWPDATVVFANCTCYSQPVRLLWHDGVSACCLTFCFAVAIFGLPAILMLI